MSADMDMHTTSYSGLTRHPPVDEARPSPIENECPMTTSVASHLFEYRVPVPYDGDGCRGPRSLEGHVHQKAAVARNSGAAALHACPAGVDVRAPGENWRLKELHRCAGLQGLTIPAPNAIGTAIKRAVEPLHRTIPPRPGLRLAAGSRPPWSPAWGRLTQETAGCKSALAWIRSTDRHPPAMRTFLPRRLIEEKNYMTGSGLRSPAIGAAQMTQRRV